MVLICLWYEISFAYNTWLFRRMKTQSKDCDWKQKSRLNS